MTKKPFSIRVETSISNRFKALATVKNMDNSQLFTEMIDEAEHSLSKDEKAAYDSLMNVWKDRDIK